MVLTRSGSNRRVEKMDTVTVTTNKKMKAAARAAIKAENAERAQMEVHKKKCYGAFRSREDAAASAYIGQMKLIGAIFPHVQHLIMIKLRNIPSRNSILQEWLFMFLESRDETCMLSALLRCVESAARVA